VVARRLQASFSTTQRRSAPTGTHTTIKVILDNHSAHISKETRHWLEGVFSKLTRSVLRHIRVESKQALKSTIA